MTDRPSRKNQMPVQQPLRTLIADQSEVFARTLARWIEGTEDLDLIGVACDAPTAIREVLANDPDLVLVEASLPGSERLGLVRALKARRDAPLVVVVTFLASGAARAEAFEAGADGFLAKDDVAASLELMLGALGRPIRRRGGEAPDAARLRSNEDLSLDE